MATADHSVLYLSYDGLTDPLGQSQILPYLGALSRYAITIVSFEKKDRFETGKAGVQEFCRTHNLNWVPLAYHKSPPVFSTLYDLRLLRQRAKSLHRKHHFRVIHCRSYITALVGLWMKRKYNVKFIFDMRGFWADERVEGGLWNLKNPVYQLIYSFFKEKERRFIREADAIISLTENARQELLHWKLNHAIHVIPCCVDLDHFDPGKATALQQDELRSELGLKPGEFVLLYLGSWGTWYSVTEMLDFFTQVKKIRRQARFLLITPDSPEIGRYPHAQDVIVRSSSRARIPLFVSLADAAVMFIKPVFSKKASSATKMAEVLAMGIPVVTNPGWGDIDRFQNTLPGLITVSKPEDYPLATAMLLQTKNPGDIRKGAANQFSLALGVALYDAVYQDLM
jgi:glycosyltransferase involved in cell wall biosynthesis